MRAAYNPCQCLSVHSILSRCVGAIYDLLATPLPLLLVLCNVDEEEEEEAAEEEEDDASFDFSFPCNSSTFWAFSNSILAFRFVGILFCNLSYLFNTAFNVKLPLVAPGSIACPT